MYTECSDDENKEETESGVNTTGKSRGGYKSSTKI